MDESSAPLRRQWSQLLALTLAHAVADVYVGIVAPVLVPLANRYNVSIALLIFVTSLLAFSANAWQIPIGNMRAFWSSPLPIGAGVFLSGLSVFLGVLPTGPLCPLWMSAVAIVTGFGVAIVHPEGLRAVHGLNKISSSLSTAVFMVAGFAGFSGGALISSAMTEAWGLKSLVWLYALAPLSVAPLFLTRVRLPIFIGKKKSESDLRENIPSIPFLPIFVMAATLATCSQIQATLLPTYLHKDVGYTLSFSGFSFTLFGVGGMIGTILLGVFAENSVNGVSGLVEGNVHQFLLQLGATVFAGAYAFGVTFLILKVINRFAPVRVTEKEELQGLDRSIIKEEAYHL